MLASITSVAGQPEYVGVTTTVERVAVVDHRADDAEVDDRDDRHLGIENGRSTAQACSTRELPAARGGGAGSARAERGVDHHHTPPGNERCRCCISAST